MNPYSLYIKLASEAEDGPIKRPMMQGATGGALLGATIGAHTKLGPMKYGLVGAITGGIGGLALNADHVAEKAKKVLS